MFILTPRCPAVTNFCSPPHQLIHSHISSPIPTHMWVNKLFFLDKWAFFLDLLMIFPPYYLCSSSPLLTHHTSNLSPVISGQCAHANPSVIIPDHPWLCTPPHSNAITHTLSNWGGQVCYLPCSKHLPECSTTSHFCVPRRDHTHMCPYTSDSDYLWSSLTRTTQTSKYRYLWFFYLNLVTKYIVFYIRCT